MQQITIEQLKAKIYDMIRQRDALNSQIKSLESSLKDIEISLNAKQAAEQEPPAETKAEEVTS